MRVLRACNRANFWISRKRNIIFEDTSIEKNHDARLNRIRSIFVVHVRKFFLFFLVFFFKNITLLLFPPPFQREFYRERNIFSKFSIHPTWRTTWAAYGKKFERRIKGITLCYAVLNFSLETFHYLNSKIPLLDSKFNPFPNFKNSIKKLKLTFLKNIPKEANLFKLHNSKWDQSCKLILKKKKISLIYNKIFGSEYYMEF